MTKLSFELHQHPLDPKTTAARIRLYDGEIPATQRLGFNCLAADFLNLEAIGEYIRDFRPHEGAPAHEVSDLTTVSSVDKPFVTALYEVRPPMSAELRVALGQQLIAGTFWRDAERQPEGIAFLDNTGTQQPDHPFDSGRSVIAQTLPTYTAAENLSA